MNANQSNLILPWAALTSFWKNKNLIYELTKREVIGRYRGSLLGLAWSFFNPIIMLAVYTFVFSVVFQAKWQAGAISNKVNFAVIIFAGMIIHSLFAECINRSPALIISNANFVKKVIFPLEILIWVTLGAALFHFLISLVILIAVQLIFIGPISSVAIFLPLVLMPLIIITIGISWFLASLGVYLRDIGQITTVVVTILMFLSPIFFPVSAIPEQYRYLLMLNPLTLFIEETRNILLFQVMPDWYALAKAYVVGIIVMSLGYWWFQKTRGGFADVL
ncbi:MAG: ABC transporter permease [Pseudomonadota bacterium]